MHSFVAHGAAIDQYAISLFNFARLCMPDLGQERTHALGVSHIHLTPKRFYENEKEPFFSLYFWHGPPCLINPLK